MACRAVLYALANADAEQLLNIRGDEALEEFVVENIGEHWDEEWLCDLDKSWDGIHRTLTDGELEWDNGEYPLNHAILGGRQLYEGDDYIFTFVSSDLVADVAQAVNSISDDEFRERFFKIDPISCQRTWGDVDEENLEYVAGWFEELKPFYAKAAAAGRSVLFTVDQ